MDKNTFFLGWGVCIKI